MIHTRKLIAITAALAALCWNVVYADTITGIQNSVKGSSNVTADANPALKVPITLRAQDASLPEILKVLSDRSGMNFVTGAGADKERITIILSKTPLDEAIDLVVRAAGLSYEIVGNSVLIASAENLKSEVGLQGYVIALKYAEATEVADMLGDLSKSIKVDKGGNKLICFASPRVINEIERIVKSVDHPNVLVMLEARIIEVSVARTKKYGIDWNGFTSFTSGISHDSIPLSKGYNHKGFVLPKIGFSATLDMLLQNGDANILMNSKLTTTNNREATLHIGEVVPYEVQTYNLTNSGSASTQIQKENIGVLLSMTPHVNDEGQVTLTVAPEVSNIESWVGANSDLPLVKVRRATTTVRVENGQTVFLAGLLSEDKTATVMKFPILGDIPLLKYIFSHTYSVTNKSNLIIEIKPTVIYSGQIYKDQAVLVAPSDTVSVTQPGNEVQEK
jgi:type II secretory pathway component GspD/PulD (secretin)